MSQASLRVVIPSPRTLCSFQVNSALPPSPRVRRAFFNKPSVLTSYILPVLAYAAAGLFMFVVLDFLYDFRRRPLLTYLLIVLSLILIEFILTAVFGPP